MFSVCNRKIPFLLLRTEQWAVYNKRTDLNKRKIGHGWISHEFDFFFRAHKINKVFSVKLFLPRSTYIWPSVDFRWIWYFFFRPDCSGIGTSSWVPLGAWMASNVFPSKLSQMSSWVTYKAFSFVLSSVMFVMLWWTHWKKREKYS